MSAALEHRIRTLSSKVAKQTAEIARLTREVEQLKADKSALHLDLLRERATADRLREQARRVAL